MMTRSGGTLISHPVQITLPAHGFADHRLERICLTRRHLTRVRPSAVIAARIERSRRVETPALPETWTTETVLETRSARRWTWASAAVLAVTALAAVSTL